MEKEVVNPEWKPGPFGAFLATMSAIGAAEWVWPYIEACSRHGVFCADENRCILARPVNSTIPIDHLNALWDLDPEHVPDRQLANAHDAWLVMFAAGGPLGGFFGLATRELPFLLWQRDGGAPRLYPFNCVKERIHGRKTKSTTEA